MRIFAAVFAFFALTAAAARADSFKIVTATEAVKEIQAQFPLLRIKEPDFGMRLGDNTLYVTQIVDYLLYKPLELAPQAERISYAAARSTATADLAAIAEKTLLLSTRAFVATATTTVVYPSDWPKELRAPLLKFYGALDRAQGRLDAAVATVSPDYREGFLAIAGWPEAVKKQTSYEKISTHIKEERFAAMESFDEQGMLEAGRGVMAAVDELIPFLKDVELSTETFKPGAPPFRWRTPRGVIALAGPGNRKYESGALDDAALLIGLGSRSEYKIPAAAAMAGQIRVVVDMAPDVVVGSSGAFYCDAGCGVFGIGLMYLPNAKGLKQILTGEFSAGCGQGGVGGLFISGRANVTGTSYSQGVATFGLGALDARAGDHSQYLIFHEGQGYAETRGVALFVHEGSSASIVAGQVEPDPRELAGASCDCQGVGMGRRPDAAGGVGIAAVSGDSITVRGNYFSMGAGYWYGLGIFRFRGNRSNLQARRYVMGSGVHQALGHFSAIGDDNRISVWGVGPAYGWDEAVGSSLIEGERVSVYADWGVGDASIGSRSYAYYNTKNSKLKLCELGRGQFDGRMGYSAQILSGEGNAVQCVGVSSSAAKTIDHLGNPWGSFRAAAGTTFVNDLGLTPAPWPNLPQKEAVKKERLHLGGILKAAKKKAPHERVADYLDVASAFSVDKNTPREAFEKLLSLSTIEVSELMTLPESGQAWGIALASYGSGPVDEMYDKAMNGPSDIRWSLLYALQRHPARLVVPKLAAYLDAPKKSTDSVPNSWVTDVLLDMLDTNANNASGRQAVLTRAQTYLDNPSTTTFADARRVLALANVEEAIGLLGSLTPDSAKTRLKFFAKTGEERSLGMGQQPAEEFLSIIRDNRAYARDAAAQELKAMSALEPRVRAEEAAVLTSTKSKSNELRKAVAALSTIGNSADAPLVAKFLSAKYDARVAEAAAYALAKFGTAGQAGLERALDTGTPSLRAIVMAALTQATARETLELLKRGLADPSPLVRLTAVSALDNMPDALNAEHVNFMRYAKDRLPSEKDDSVRVAISLLR